MPSLSGNTDSKDTLDDRGEEPMPFPMKKPTTLRLSKAITPSRISNRTQHTTSTHLSPQASNTSSSQHEVPSLVSTKAKLDPGNPLEELMEKEDIWVYGILPFIGHGHFLFVAGVCHRFKKNYLAYFDTIKGPPLVWDAYQEEESQAIATNTLHSVAFSNVPCAQHWDKTSKGKANRLKDSLVCDTVAMHGNLQVLQWAHQQDFPWDEETCCNAAKNGNLEVLKYAHENGCPWHEYTCHEAAERGHMKILKYAHEHGCPWTAATSACAAHGGHLEVLKYAHEKGCPWDEDTCAEAAGNGHLEILKWAEHEGCPWDWRTYAWAAKTGYNEIAEWAQSQGCPLEEPHDWDQMCWREMCASF